jgi:NADPH-dependent curcumin reductase CurA
MRPSTTEPPADRLYGEFQTEVAKGVTSRRIKYREDIVDGLENAPGALLGLLAGKNFGKVLIRVRGLKDA